MIGQSLERKPGTVSEQWGVLGRMLKNKNDIKHLCSLGHSIVDLPQSLISLNKIIQSNLYLMEFRSTKHNDLW